MSSPSGISIERLREVLAYDKATGLFVWKKQLAPKGKVGTVAGFLRPDGYRDIKVDRMRISAHRLAWLYVYGELPSGQIDHANGNRDDNRIGNLRIATTSENAQNAIGRVSQYAPGVSRTNGRFMARLSVNRKSHFLGCFATVEEAAAAYAAAKRRLHPFAPVRRTRGDA